MQIDMRRIDPSLNLNRFYSMELTKDLFGQHGVHRQWGRFGTWGRHRHDWYATKNEAVSAPSKLVKQKLARGYLIKLPQSDG
ncbi:MAG: WGR domain-containing protein [Paracoccaceae bacterium]